jgi:hypothetical protein
MLCQIILTPWESKRLIAKAVVQLPEVQYALNHSIVCVAKGTTTSFIMDEILTHFKKENYCIGCIEPDRLCLVQKENQIPEMSFVKGEVKEIPSAEMIKEMGAHDVFIKGANAVDCNFEAGILLGSPVGGTIGKAIGAVYAKGINFIVPVGLEKLIPYPVKDVLSSTGFTRVDYAMGMPVGLFPVHGKVVTEIQALQQFGVTGVPIASGGVNGAEGATVLSVYGEERNVQNVLQVIESIKGETPLKIPAGDCSHCEHATCARQQKR